MVSSLTIVSDSRSREAADHEDGVEANKMGLGPPRLVGFGKGLRGVSGQHLKDIGNERQHMPRRVQARQA